MRFLRLLIVPLVLLSAAGAAGETVIRDLKNTKIIRSEEKPHNILGEACVACHPKEKFDFWLLIYKGKAPSVSIERLEGKAGARGGGGAAEETAKPKNRYNSHDALSCNFCHFDNPTGTAPRFIVDIQGLCQLCHQAIGLHNLPEKDDQERIRAAIAARKLPGSEGRIMCTTCHKIHEATYGMREEYARLLWEGKVPNPHGSRSLCFACHPGRIKEGTEVKLSGGRDVVNLCNECHLKPGVRKALHVVDATSSEGTWRMDYLGYPLSQGKLICSTCHDEVSHGRPDPANPRFLRGGPYDDTDRFCYKCHLEERESLNNPHRQIDGFGRVREEACRYCHKGFPDPAGPDPAALETIGNVDAICTNCHQSRPHPDVDHLKPLSHGMAARKEEYEKNHQVRLPLAGNGNVTCSTCHNPHAKGVLKGDSGVGAGSKWRVPDFREMCAPCHGRY